MSMMISIVSVAAFAMMSMYMLAKAHFAATRRVAGVALLMAAGETALFGLLSGVTNPAVMLLLVAARVTVLVACAMAMKNDRDEYKARVRLRNRFRVDLYNTMEPLRLVRRQRAAARIDIVA